VLEDQNYIDIFVVVDRDFRLQRLWPEVDIFDVVKAFVRVHGFNA